MHDDVGAFVVVGLLSLGYDHHVRCCPRRGSGSVAAARRSRIRLGAQPFLASSKGIALRFIVASLPPPEEAFASNRQKAVRALARVEEEATVWRDILFVNQSESFFRCSEKYLRFYRVALERFPSAQFFVAGDDDVYVQLAHLEADLRLVQASLGDEAPRSHTLWGLITWRAFALNTTLDTEGPGFLGWTPRDSAAVGMRRRVELCRDSFLTSGASAREFHRAAVGETRNHTLVRERWPPCAKLVVPGTRRAVGRTASLRDRAQEKALWAVSRNGIDPSPPYPQANGPLFGVSRPLASLLADDPLPWRWLSRLDRTPLAQQSRQRGGKVPYYLKEYACFPMGDSALGYWASAVARSRGKRLTLVNTPFMHQHLPWPVSRFGNATIVVHGIKSANTSLWTTAARRTAGPFVPFRRVCDTCQQRGWSSWPTADANAWRCCG